MQPIPTRELYISSRVRDERELPPTQLGDGYALKRRYRWATNKQAIASLFVFVTRRQRTRQSHEETVTDPVHLSGQARGRSPRKQHDIQ